MCLLGVAVAQSSCVQTQMIWRRLGGSAAFAHLAVQSGVVHARSCMSSISCVCFCTHAATCAQRHPRRLLLPLLLCAGRIGKIRLLGDLQHSTRIAFIEFIDAEAAMAALNCSGALLGELMQMCKPTRLLALGCVVVTHSVLRELALFAHVPSA